MRELDIEAKVDNLGQVTGFIDEQLEEAGCSVKTQMQIDLAVEEIFVNIASYAYAPGSGRALIQTEIKPDGSGITIVFSDSGTPYDPLAKDDPDTTLSVNERAIGGLGIFLVKKTMDDMFYEYRDGCNVLTIVKGLK